VYRVDPKTVVKKSLRMAEAETMKFVQANTTITAPTVQNVYRDQESGYVMNVMDYVEGITLEAAWDDYTEAEQESVISQLRGYMA
jgi:fructosamine-3-kinase